MSILRMSIRSTVGVVHERNVDHVYAGLWVSGESIVRIEGYVDQQACDYALASLGEFVAEGVARIIFDHTQKSLRSEMI